MLRGLAGSIPLLALLGVVAACKQAGPVAEVVYAGSGEPAGLHRYRRWSNRIGQGAQPEGEIAFQNLAALGFKTVLSVDGAIPDVANAEKHGLRYVHVPIGYDGVPRDDALKIVKAVRASDGPVFFHCHHGKHRGSAAAMVARIAVDGISNETAVKAMAASGASRSYEGLYGDVANLVPPTEDELATVSADLPSKVVPEGMRAMMVGVDTRFGILKASKVAAWKTPAGHPDISPPHEARMLRELFREIARTDQARERGPKFLGLLKQGEEAAVELENALRSGDQGAADRAYRRSKRTCGACHADHRN